MKSRIFTCSVLFVVFLCLTGCLPENFFSKPEPRLVLFVGVDISGSFLRSKYFDDSLYFLAHYLYAHLKGLGGLEEPKELFVGSIGGSNVGEAKTLYPIQTFKYKTIPEIHEKLKEIFPKKKENVITDFNAFFHHISETVSNRRLILKPLAIVLLSDGVPDVPEAKQTEAFRQIVLKPLENLSRNIVIRLLYTDAQTGDQWTTLVPRKRVRILTQDAVVMKEWRDPSLLIPQKSIEDQNRFLDWIKDQVDYPVRLERVD
ncbi:hypothetical protein MYX78_09360 [Acidobacteria bacterium AH-259-G07]|nr:hypothetical protein [Acidobacteria bacterium AH-259-G07]